MSSVIIDVRYILGVVLTLPELVAAWEHLLEFGEAFLGATLLEFRGRDVVEIF